MRRPQRSVGHIMFCAICLTSVTNAHAAQLNIDWIAGGNGNWNVAGNWLDQNGANQVPNNGANTFNVFIDHGNAANVTVTLNQHAWIDNLTVDALDELYVGNSFNFAIGQSAVGGTVANSGTIRVNSAVNPTNMLLEGDVTFTGMGTMRLDDTYSVNSILHYSGGQATDKLINQDNTFEGRGIIGDGALAIKNQTAGVIQANSSAGSLTIVGSAGVANSGTLQATAAGVLSLSGGTFTNYIDANNGLILAQDASTVQIQNATAIVGGTLQTSGSGVIQGYGSVTLQNLTLDGHYQVTNATNTTLKGAIVNQGGSITVKSAVNNTNLMIDGEVTLSGAGTVRLDDNYSTNSILHFSGGLPNDKLINQNNTIEGRGTIGDSAIAIENQAAGLIQANSSGNVLTLVGSGGVANSGTLQATAAGTLLLNGGTFTNYIDTDNGLILAQDASAVQIQNATVVGGTLQTTGSGIIQGFGNVTLQNLTVDGNYQVTNASNTTLQGAIVNQGNTITVNSTTNGTNLLIEGDVTLSGNGTVRLDDNYNTNAILYHGGGQAIDKLINQNNTIEGRGTIGDSAIAIENQAAGLIQANSTGNVLTVAGPAGIANSGIMKATAGGILSLSGGTFTNHINTDNGLILAQDASQVQIQNNTTIVGGTLQTTGSGLIQSFWYVTLQDLTINGAYQVANAGSTLLKGAIVNQGNTITLKSTVNPTSLLIEGDVTLSGAGTVRLDDAYNANGILHLSGGQATDKLINQDNTIAGRGTIGDAGLATVNQASGVILADSSTNTLTIVGSAGVVNSGVMKATAAGILSLSGGIFTNYIADDPGLILAEDASTVQIQNATTIVGGTLQTTGGGLIQGVGTVTLQDLTIDGSYQVANASNTLLLGNIVNQDNTITIKSTVNPTNLQIDGTVTLSGGGTVRLDDTYSVNSILHRSSGLASDRLINQDNTIMGRGTVGDVGLVLVNRGIIDANSAAGPLTLTAGSTGVLNDAGGILRASAPGGLTVTATTFNNQGLVEAANGATVTFSSTAVMSNYNATTDTLTGGAWKAMAGSTISFNGNPPIVTNAADVTLRGSGSVFVPINSIAHNAAGGAFRVLDGRGFTAAADLDNGGDIEVGFASSLSINGSYLQTAGTTTVNGSLATTAGADIQGGKLIGTGTVTAGTGTTNAGTVAPGPATGLSGELDFIGSYTQTSTGRLQIELTGPAIAQYDRLVIDGGSASLAGTLDLELVSYSPAYGVQFSILTAPSITGRFAAIEGVLAQSDLALAVDYLSNAVVITTAIPGDANLDGKVNLSDLQILGDHWQNTAALWSMADFTGDSKVNLADLQVIGEHWGYGTSVDLAFEDALQLTGAQIPEPAALLLLALGSAILCVGRGSIMVRHA